MVIWKFVLELGDNQIEMPHGADVLSVGIQAGSIYIWAKCSPNHPRMKRTFSVVGTGHWVPKGLGGFIGTVQSDQFACHVFEN